MPLDYMSQHFVMLPQLACQDKFHDTIKVLTILGFIISSCLFKQQLSTTKLIFPTTTITCFSIHANTVFLVYYE